MFPVQVNAKLITRNLEKEEYYSKISRFNITIILWYPIENQVQSILYNKVDESN